MGGSSRKHLSSACPLADCNELKFDRPVCVLVSCRVCFVVDSPKKVKFIKDNFGCAIGCSAWILQQLNCCAQCQCFSS